MNFPPGTGAARSLRGGLQLELRARTPGGARGRSHWCPRRFKNLARQHQSMFPSLEVDVEGQLKRLKVEQRRGAAGRGSSGDRWGELGGRVRRVAWRGTGQRRGRGRGAAGPPHGGAAPLSDALGTRGDILSQVLAGPLGDHRPPVQTQATEGRRVPPSPEARGSGDQETFPGMCWGKTLSLSYLG